ncbi:protoporphyrinogen oxidase [Bacteroidota bacterium]
MEHFDIIIIGSGLTGLTVAHYLNKNGKKFKVLEKKSSFGGVINTINENGFTYEEGPNTGVIGQPEVAELFEELSDLCELEIANEQVKKRYILKNGKWEALPGGLKAAIKTPLFTTKDKFRILLEPFRKPGTNPHETLAELVKRRMGQSFLNYAIDPFILGVYSGDPNILVPKYALPKLYNLEQNYGSFIGGAVKKKFEKKDERMKKATREVFSAKGGLSSLTEALFKSAGKNNFNFNAEGIKVKPENGKFIISTKINGKEQAYKSNKVITTIGAYNLADILPFIDNNDIDKISALYYARVIEVTLGFNEWKGFNLDGFGGLVPHIEKRDILGVLFLSSLLKNKAPEGGALLTVFMGGVRRDELVDLPNDKIKSIIESEITETMCLDEFKPDLFKIVRHEKAIPQYAADSGIRFETIDKIQNQYPGLIIAGNLRDGIGMADRIKQGKMLAEQVL